MNLLCLQDNQVDCIVPLQAGPAGSTGGCLRRVAVVRSVLQLKVKVLLTFCSSLSY